MPLGGGGGIGVTALELGDIGFPLSLTRQCCQPRVVGLPVKVVNRVAYHEQAVAQDVYLHVENAHTADARLDLGPHVGASLDIFLYQLAVVAQL